MLSKEYRLKKRKEFAYIYRVGDATHTKYLSLISTPTKRNVRIGFSVSKKVGKAYMRNLIKRRLTEIIKKHLPNMDQHYNYVIVAKVGIADLTFSQLANDVELLLNRSGRLQ